MSMPAGFGTPASYSLPSSYSGTFQQPSFPAQAAFPQQTPFAQQPNGRSADHPLCRERGENGLSWHQGVCVHI